MYLARYPAPTMSGMLGSDMRAQPSAKSADRIYREDDGMVQKKPPDILRLSTAPQSDVGNMPINLCAASGVIFCIASSS